MLKAIMRLFGVRTIVSPEAVRVTLPRWMVRLMPDVLEKTRQSILRDYPTAYDVRVVSRSIVAKIRGFG